MKRKPLSRCVRRSRSLPLAGVLLLVPASLLPAADRFWINASGGSFNTTANWSATEGGPGGASVPATADAAVFALSSTYTVNGTPGTNFAIRAASGNVTLDLAGGTYTLTANNSIRVGSESGQTGRLTVRDGTLGVDDTAGTVLIGNDAGATGFLTVGSNGILGAASIRPSFFAGTSGNGTLTVNENGAVNGTTLNAGALAGSTGVMTISGPNATAGFNGGITMGHEGTGTLSVLNGGTLTGSSMTLGTFPGADGTATVSGPGSSWTVNTPAFIGNSGDGTLTVSSGGLLTSGASTLGNNGTGTGTATVTGAGSLWMQTGSLIVGSSGVGTLNVASGGRATGAGSSTLGNSAGAEGRVTVSGAGSLWSTSNSLSIGQAGAGVLMVSAGGETVGDSLSVANGTGTGEVTITGTGSTLRTTGGTAIAFAGNGALSVLSGGSLLVGTNLTVSNPAGSAIGTLTIDGGSVYVANDFTNIGSFTFNDGLLSVNGNFQHAASLEILTINGFGPDDLPVLELSGRLSTTSNLDGIAIGANRRGKLVLRQGRNVTAPIVALGVSPGGEGTLSVESGAQLTVPSSTLVVGGNVGGTGTVNIAGGTVDVNALQCRAAGTINLSSGTLAMDFVFSMDGNFHWTGGTLRFDAATALTNLLAQGFFGPVPALHSGQILASTAALTLQTPLLVDGGVINASSFINQSRLEIRSGAVTGPLQNDGLLLGDGLVSGAVTNNAAGRIRVDAGDSLTFTGTFAPNAGQLTFLGGVMEFAGPVTNAATGYISGRGALFTGGLTSNGVMAFSGGNMDLFGDVTLGAGSVVETSGDESVTTFWDDVVHNGTEIYTGAGCSTVFFGAQSGSGSYTGTGTVYFNGDLRPGNSPAIVSCEPDAFFSPSSRVTMEIGGLTPGTQHDRMVFTSDATPQVKWSGTLTVTLINGFTPAAGHSFDLFDFDPARDSGTFRTLTLPALSNGLAWDTANLYTTGTLRVVTTTGLTFAQWAATVLGNPAATPGGDHDSDGFSNGTEFALGLFPLQPNAVIPNGGLHTYADGERLRVLFTRPLDRTGVTLSIQASTDLINWTDLAVSINSAAFTGPGFVSENRSHPVNEPGLVEVRDILTASTAPRRQIRVLITVAP